MKRISIVILVMLFAATTAFAVNTTTVGSSDSVIQIVADDSTDWVWEDDLSGEGAAVLRGKITRIVFYPSAASDRCVLNDYSENGAAYFDSGLVSGADDPRTVEYKIHRNIRLYLDADDYTCSTPSSCKILIYLEN